MKLRDFVKITEDRKLSYFNIREYLDQNPGATAWQVASYFNLANPRGVQDTSSRLSQLAKATHNPIQKQVIDGRMRYYPHNYSMMANAIPTKSETVPSNHCPLCGKEFKSPLSAKRHHYAVHTEQGRANIKKMYSSSHKKRKYNFKQHVRPSETPQTVKALEQLAKDYFWETGDTNLRTFIKWVKRDE